MTATPDTKQDPASTAETKGITSVTTTTTKKKLGPLYFLLQHDTFQPLHKLLNGGSFCDPFQTAKDQNKQTSSSNVFVQDLTEQDQEILFGTNDDRDVVEMTEDGVEVHQDVLDGSESTSTPPAQAPKSTDWRSIFTVEDSQDTESGIDEEEDATDLVQSTATPVEPLATPIRVRTRSLSSEGGDEIKLAEAHTPKGAPRSPSTAAKGTVDVVTPPPSSAGKILNFLLLWTVAFVAALFLHPDTGYDLEWIHQTSEQVQSCLHSQATRCQSFRNGGRSTGCMLEQIQKALQDEVAQCQAYAHGKKDTSCVVEVGVQALTETGHQFKRNSKTMAASIQAERSRCDAFLAGTQDTGCSLERAQDVWVHYQDWTVQMADQVQDRVLQEYTACSDFVQYGKTGTNCPLEHVRDLVQEQHAWVSAKLTETQERVNQDYTACHAYLQDGKVDTSCPLEVAHKELSYYKGRAQNQWEQAKDSMVQQGEKCQLYFQVAHKELSYYKGRAQDQWKQTKDSMVQQGEKCQLYFQGQMDTGCVLEAAKEQVTVKAAQVETWLKMQATELQTYLEEGTSQQLSEEQETAATESSSSSMEELVEEADEAVAEPTEPSSSSSMEEVVEEVDAAVAAPTEPFSSSSMEKAVEEVGTAVAKPTEPSSSSFMEEVGEEVDTAVAAPTEPSSREEVVEDVDTAVAAESEGSKGESQVVDETAASTSTEDQPSEEEQRKFAESYFDRLEPVPAEKLATAENTEEVAAPEMLDEVDESLPSETIPVEMEEQTTENSPKVETNIEEEPSSPSEDDEVSDGEAMVGEASNPIDVSDSSEHSLADSDTATEETVDEVQYTNNLEAQGTHSSQDEVRVEEEIVDLITQENSAEPETRAFEAGDGTMDFVQLKYDESGKPYLVRVGKKLEGENKPATNYLPQMKDTLRATSYGYFFGRK